MTTPAGVSVVLIGTERMDALLAALRSDPRVAAATRVDSLDRAGQFLAEHRPSIDGVVLATTTEHEAGGGAPPHVGAIFGSIPVLLYEDRTPAELGGSKRYVCLDLDEQVPALVAVLDPVTTSRGILDALDGARARRTPDVGPSAGGPQTAGPLIFLCHSSGDKERIRMLYRSLTADGLRCWLDEEDIVGGQSWALEIKRAMARSDHVLIFLSRTWVHKAGYSQREVNMALDRAKEQPEGAIFIVPVKLEECEPPDSLAHLQWIDLHAEGGYRKVLRALHQ